MRLRFWGLIACVGLLAFMSGCNEPTTNNNTTANTNANANVNTNTTTSNANTNAKANTNRAPTREEYEKDKERYQREAKQSGRTVGTGLNDGWIWVKSRFELAAANDLRDSTINVDVENGVVTLTGTVANAEQKKKADDTVKAIDGVKSVRNLLKISASGNTNVNTNKNANKNANRK